MIEYKIVAALSPLSEEQVDEFGKDWWSLVTIIFYNSNYWHYFIRIGGSDNG